MTFRYGWKDGELEMEIKPLSEHEKILLSQIEDIAFKEMGERTRCGSGDDQAYVNSMYDDLKKDFNSKLLVRIVFRLCREVVAEPEKK